ncbi:MAG TPA: peptide ABC transporter substrate-binding protein [Steroidobacteraceae bacterium]|jgi:oligopeptide transport system substrate-binding protein|nr:peptide ABC transporter substrate-binding protein [Steroidobacteraceae bacterium]
MRSAARALVPLLTLAALCGCSRSPGPVPGGTAAQGATILLRGLGAEPDSLDPQKARADEAQRVLRDICEGLTTLDASGGVAPGIAEKWQVSPDGKTYTFTLRHDARWSNGQPVVGADFVAGLRRLVDPGTASQYAEVVDVIANAGDIVAGRKPSDSLGVFAPDPYTVIVRLRTPAPYLPTLLSHPSTCPVNPVALANDGEAYARPGNLPSDGAFVLSQWIHGSYIYLTRNRHYWNDAATRLEGVKYLITTDENAELTLYRADQLDITDVIPKSQYGWIRAHLGDQLHIAPELGVYFYGFDLQRAPFAGDVQVRRALAMSIDREKIAKLVLRSGELPAYGWIPPGVADYTPQSPDYRALSMAQRVAEARKLYAQAGYSAARPLRFELRYNTGEVHAEVAIAVASMWQQALGAQVTLRAEEFRSLMQDIDRGDVQMFRSSWIGDYNDAYTFAQYFKSDFGINLTHYHSVAYDELLDRAAGEVDAAKRRALLEQAEQVMLRDQPVIPIYFYVSKHLVKPRVSGWYNNIMNVTYSKDLGLRPAAH